MPNLAADPAQILARVPIFSGFSEDELPFLVQREPGAVHVGPGVLYQGTAFSRALEFLHFGLSAKNHLRTALASLRERGDPDESGWVRDSLILHEENNPSPPASPYPLPSERAVINCGPAVNANAERGGAFKPRCKARPTFSTISG